VVALGLVEVHRMGQAVDDGLTDVAGVAALDARRRP